MSDWIRVTNLPQEFNTSDAVKMFEDIGPIKRLWIGNDEDTSSLCASIQFFSARNARLAASKKDRMVWQNKTVRIRIIWNAKETLTTVKVANFPIGMIEKELEDYFISYGAIVDLKICEIPTAVEMSESVKKNRIALISYSRVDYALSACRELHNSIISGSNSSNGLSVTLLNGDARNLKWKRDRFEFVRCAFPTKKTKGVNAFHCHISRNRPNQDFNIIDSINKSPSPPSSTSSMVSCDNLQLRTKNQSNKDVCNKQDSKSVPLSQGSPNSKSLKHECMNTNANVNVNVNANTIANTIANTNTNTNTNANANTNANVIAMDQLLLPQSMSQIQPKVCNDWMPRHSRSLSFSSNYQQNDISCSIISPMSCVTPLTIDINSDTDFTKISSTCNNGSLPLPQPCHFSSPSKQKKTTDSPLSLSSDARLRSPSPVTLHSTNSTLSSNANKGSELNHANVSNTNKDNGKKSSSVPFWTAEQRKNGDMIYYELKSEFPQEVAKLTGMMLALPKQELDQLIRDKSMLKARARQLVKIL